ncbi:MAG TPA: hypothetical protein P5556_09925 [Candidatus Gastranaerophilales bacterium]|nr:hypothetical protein [Candidatus Gastranaerophilales bacterium]
MLAKLLFFVTILNYSLGLGFELPRDDLIILESGERIEGHIQSINSAVIMIKTGHGEKTVVRDVDIFSPRDITEVGIIKNKRYSGHIKYLNSDVLEIETSSGKQTINRALVRKIIISHESTLPPLDL